MIGLDTNVLVRLLADDDAVQTARARRAIAAAEAASEPVLLNDIVLVETAWTMGTRFRARKEAITGFVSVIVDAPAFAFDNRSVVEQALSLYRASSADFADCLIVARNAALGARATLSFDEGFRGMPGTKLL